MNIRAATPADAEPIARVHVDTWRAAYRGLIPDVVLNALDVSRRARFWEEQLNKLNTLLVAEIGGTVCGFVDLIPSRDKDADPATVAEIAAIYVLPEHWRKGLGRVLCSQALREARKQAFSAVTLWVLSSNVGAQAFYKAMGFAMDGCQKTEQTPEGATLKETRFRISL